MLRAHAAAPLRLSRRGGSRAGGRLLEGLCATPAELAWVADSGRFDGVFVDRLAALRFTGDVDAMPEGTPFFPDAPILRVIAPLPEAQLVETRLVNLLHLQTPIATQAARCRI